MAGKGRGYFGHSREHGLHRKGISTKIDEHRRFAVNNFVARGEEISRFKNLMVKEVNYQNIPDKNDLLGLMLDLEKTMGKDSNYMDVYHDYREKLLERFGKIEIRRTPDPKYLKEDLKEYLENWKDGVDQEDTTFTIKYYDGTTVTVNDSSYDGKRVKLSNIENILYSDAFEIKDSQYEYHNHDDVFHELIEPLCIHIDNYPEPHIILDKLSFEYDENDIRQLENEREDRSTSKAHQHLPILNDKIRRLSNDIWLARYIENNKFRQEYGHMPQTNEENSIIANKIMETIKPHYPKLLGRYSCIRMDDEGKWYRD